MYIFFIKGSVMGFKTQFVADYNLIPVEESLVMYLVATGLKEYDCVIDFEVKPILGTAFTTVTPV